MDSQGPESSSSGGQGNNTVADRKERVMRASANGNAEIIKEMWRSTRESDMWDILKSTTDEDGMTPLHRAVIAEHKEVVDALLPGRSDPGGLLIDFNFLHARTDEGWTAIHLAVFSDNEAILKVLTSKYDSCKKPRASRWDFADLWWMTPLHYAVLGNKVAQMKQLLGWRCYEPHLNARDYFQRTPLHLAACHRPVSVEELLQHRTVDINAKDSFMQTPFHWAVCFGRVDVVRRLVKILLDPSGRPVQVTNRDFEGRSVLEIAIQDTLLDPIPSFSESLPSEPKEHDKWVLEDPQSGHQSMVHKEVTADIEKLLRLCPDVKEEAKSLQTNLTIRVTVLTSYLLVAGWIASATFTKMLALSDYRVLNFITVVIHVLSFCSSGGTLLSCATTLRFLARTVHIGQRSLVVRRAISLIGRMLVHVGVWCFGAFICDNAAYILNNAGDFQYSSNMRLGLLLALGLSVAAGLLLHMGAARSIVSLSQHELVFLTGRSKLSDIGAKEMDTGASLFQFFVNLVGLLPLPVATKNKLCGERDTSFFGVRGQEEDWSGEERTKLLQKLENIKESISSLQPSAQQPDDFADGYWKQKDVPPKILKQFKDIRREVSRLEDVYAKLSKDLCHQDLEDVQSVRTYMRLLDRLPRGLFYWEKNFRWLQLPTMWEPIMFPYQILNMEFLDPRKLLSVFFRGYVFGKDFIIFEDFCRKISVRKDKLRIEVMKLTNSMTEATNPTGPG